MKFGQFLSYCKTKNFIKKFFKNRDLKTSSKHFYVCQKLSTTSIGKKKTIKMCPNQDAGLFRFPFKEDLLKNKKGLELVFRSHIS